jgi:hypothetical protein
LTQDPAGDCIIRIEALDWPGVQADSGVFHVVAKPEPVEVTTFHAAKIVNADLVLDHTASHNQHIEQEKIWGYPEGTIARVGFFGYCTTTWPIGYECGASYVYRSWLFFDLKGLADVEVLKAKLSIKADVGTEGFGYRLYFLTQPWNGNAGHLFSITGITLVKGGDLTSVVRGWIKPGMTPNYGLLLVSMNEDKLGECTNFKGVHLFTGVQLEVRERHFH